MGWAENYCAGCYSDASKHGRVVRKTDVYEYPLCTLCESRMREGLIHYRPSNGSEANMFEAGCWRCRHYIDDPDDPENPKPGSLSPPYQCCAWGVLDRLYQQMWSDYDHISNWFNPEDLRSDCPATCLRFTRRDDPDGELRDPSPVPHPAQMTFGDLDIPVEVMPPTPASVNS